MSTEQPNGGTPGQQPVLRYAATPQTTLSAVVWCRILAVWMFAWGLYSAAQLVGEVIQAYSMFAAQRITWLVWVEYPVALTLTVAVWLAAAFYCWRHAPLLAKKMAEHADTPISLSPMNSDELLYILLTAIGVYLLAEGVPYLVGAVVQMGLGTVRPVAGQQFELRSWMISAAIRCGCGLWLILRTHQAVALLRKYSSGRTRSSDGQRY